MAAKLLPSAHYIRERLDYDPLTGVFTWKHCEAFSGRSSGWNTKYAGNIAGCIKSGGNKHPYRHIIIDYISYLAHRLAWLMMTGEAPSEEIDHIDGDGTNNEWSNLRSATHKENMANTVLMTRNTSGGKGVDRLGINGKWRARINGRHIGCFNTREQAILARNIAAFNLRGDFCHKTHP